MTEKHTEREQDGRPNGGATSKKATAAARAAKREQFLGSRRRSPLAWIAPIVVLAVIAVVAVVMIERSGGAAPPTATAPVQPATTAASDRVTIPLSDISDGRAHFYGTVVDGVEVKYFVVESADGTVRAAFDACDVCFPNKKGYHQEGDVMVCNNCGRRFPLDQIDVQQGGCNPAPLARKVTGETLIIETADIAGGARYFL